MQALNVKVAMKKANVTVREIVTPNLKKNEVSAVIRKIPLPSVVMYPPKILTPIYLNDCCIFNSLVSSFEWM